MAGEKTEKATPKRRQEERKKGNVFQSKEVVTVFSLIVMFYALKAFGPYFMTVLEEATAEYIRLGAQADALTVSDARLYLLDGMKVFALTALPLLLLASALGIVLTGMQTRFLFSTKALAFKGSRINPLEGLKRMVSLRGLVELFKSLLKIVVLSAVIYRTFLVELPLFPRLMDMSVEQAFFITGGIILSIVKTAAILFVFLAASDYLYQWWDYEKNLRMSKQDIKEEYKQTEGDPQVKGKIKERQQQQARRRMMQSVPKADVVIRNPTHFAVALRYDTAVSASPVVVAKGADSLALKIVEVAEQNGVVVLENKPLARGLYETVELDQPIPEQFFKPVAEVLAYVYSLRGKERNR